MNIFTSIVLFITTLSVPVFASDLASSPDTQNIAQTPYLNTIESPSKDCCWVEIDLDRQPQASLGASSSGPDCCWVPVWGSKQINR